MCTDVFGAGWQHFRIAHLSTGDRIGVELFEFNNQQNPEDNFEYWKTGVFHFCVQDPNLEKLAEKIVEAGGKKRMKAPRYYYPGEKPYRMIYMEDPFGNILEIYSHSYELHYASGAYE
jgi:lactoylglutathione lyase family protein